ncbi:CvpA family protein [Inediibacterium massiliense]|uniref:CvpA family protein n=1 Tax=Inediibacterium massiliense TaxID=1658111 RepID=UPI0006B4D149|nr:CvpA family protein [Inediibacterium massiliense]
MNWMDVSVLVILFIGGMKGWRRGLVLSFFHTFSYIVAGIVAKIYYPFVSKYMIENGAIFSKVENLVYNRFESANAYQASSGGIIAQRSVFQILDFPQVLQEFCESTQELAYHNASNILAKMFINFLSVFIIFIGVKLLWFLIGYCIDTVVSFPILNEVNRSLGALLGAGKGFLIVLIIITILTPFATMKDSSVLEEGLEKSTVVKFLYNHNPIVGLLKD